MLNDRNGKPFHGESGPMKGIVTPLVTPLTDRDTLDCAGLERLVEYVLEGGVHGLFLLGTTGEAAALSATLHRELVRRVMQLVEGRTPILVGVSHNSVVESLRLAQDVSEMGVRAIVVTTPSYLPIDQNELLRYIRLFDRESPLPVMLYNMPRLTSHWFAVETIREALQLRNVIGLKDSSGDMSYFSEVRDLIAARPDWSLFIGRENLLADAVKLGAHGCVGGGSNVWPQLLVDIYHSALRDDQSRIRVLQQILQQMGQIYQFGSCSTGVVRGIKCGLELLGICSARMAEPFARCNDSQRAEIERHLLGLGLLVGKNSPAPTLPVIATPSRAASVQ
jgi:4-hydroxy-tetrahydrodipicolinate synthase